MASPPCNSGDGNEAVFVGTFLTTGDAVALCDECMVPWAAAMLAAMTGVDPTPFLMAVSDDVPEVDLAAIDATEDTGGSDLIDRDPTPPTRRPGRSRSASPAAGTDGAHHADPSPTDDAAPSPAA